MSVHIWKQNEDVVRVFCGGRGRLWNGTACGTSLNQEGNNKK